MTDIRLASASEIARRIRQRELTSRAAVDVHIEQIERVNPQINAVVKTRFSEARAEAEAADRRIAEGDTELPPFHGVPCTIKECFGLSGMPQSTGLLARKDVVANEDATSVARIRAAGAIPLGVTNTSELCMWMESVNFVYGRTNNPYDLSRIVGGSSGGEGAVVAAAASPFGLGSDVGGSIRGPAFFNGIFGHKPSSFLVPNSGQYPDASGEIRRYLCSGPMCRRAEDLMPLLRLLAGPDAAYPECASPEQLGDPATVSFEGRALVSIEDNGVIPISPELLAAQRRVAQHLQGLGMRLRMVQLPALRKQFDIWSAMMGLANDTPFGTVLGDGKPIRPLWEMLKWGVGKSKHTWMATTLAATDPVPKLFPKAAARMYALGHQLRQELDGLLGGDGLLLYPSYSVTAPRHKAPARWATRLHMPWAYQAIINVLELPSTQVPLGLDAQGLPLGVQVIGAHLMDHVTIAGALELERRFGGWRPPRLAGLPDAASTPDPIAAGF